MVLIRARSIAMGEMTERLCSSSSFESLFLHPSERGFFVSRKDFTRMVMRPAVALADFAHFSNN